MGNRSVAGLPPENIADSNSAFQRELERARRHLAKLEAEAQLRRPPGELQDAPHFDESPRFVKTCNAMIWVIVLAPVVLALVMLAQRLAD